MISLEQVPLRGAYYRKHFLDLAGLGVRDLGVSGDDLWILAGPTMSLDGPVALYRWRDPFEGGDGTDTLTRLDGDRLLRELVLPFGVGEDHPEGFTFIGGATSAPREVMVVYDTPNAARLVGTAGVAVDVFKLGS